MLSVDHLAGSGYRARRHSPPRCHAREWLWRRQRVWGYFLVIYWRKIEGSGLMGGLTPARNLTQHSRRTRSQTRAFLFDLLFVRSVFFRQTFPSPGLSHSGQPSIDTLQPLGLRGRGGWKMESQAAPRTLTQHRRLHVSILQAEHDAV